MLLRKFRYVVLASLGITSQIALAAAQGQNIENVSYLPRLSVGVTIPISAVATSFLPVKYTGQTPNICKLTPNTDDGYLITGLAVGLCKVVLEQPGDAEYKAADPINISIDVTKGSQTIGAITFEPAQLTVDNVSSVIARSSSKLPVRFKSNTTNICNVVGNMLIGRHVGICTIVASQPGNVNYNASLSKSANIVVARGVQIISGITFSASSVGVGKTVTVSSSSTSKLPIKFISKTRGLCATNGNLIIGIAKGVCTIAATQDGNTDYLPAAPQIKTLNVTDTPDLLTQSIGGINFNPASLSINGTTTVTASATWGLAVSFNSLTPSVCSVLNNSVRAISAGTCTIAANQAGNSTYAPAPQKTQSIEIKKSDQTISAFTFSPNTLKIGDSAIISASASSGLAVSFVSQTPSICTVNSNIVTANVEGNCIISANQSGNANYNAAPQKMQTLSVGSKLISQSIGGINFNPASFSINGTTTVTASATSGLAVSFNSLTPSVCSVLNNSVTPISAGTCTIAANQAGNSTYAPAPQKTQSIEIKKADQTISGFTFSPNTLKVAGTTTISATATSGLTVSFSSSTSNICTISGAIISGKAEGNCIIAANQPGNANYNAAPQKTQTIVVSSIINSFSFEPEMVSIPAGSFLMGSPISENGDSNERPQHTVNLSAFEIGKYEITFDEYDAFANDTGRSKPSDSGWGRGKRPVIYVSWNDADAYVKWLSNKTGRNYQLPTEAQWEYAARAGTTTAYWWGDSIGNNKANCDYCGDSFSGTSPVGSFGANPWGVYDTVGNVWEWVRDWYDGSFYSSSEALLDDPSNNHASVSRVLRGGSWDVDAWYSRAALRNWYTPGTGGRIGFRVVCLPQE